MKKGAGGFHGRLTKTMGISYVSIPRIS